MRKINDIRSFLTTIPQQVWIILLIYFVQGVLHNLGHPVTPKLVENMDIADKYFGFYFAAMSFGLLLGAPIWGVLGDRGNKRLYIFIGLFIYSIGQYAFAYVGDENIMILFRFISGFGVSASITLFMSHLIEHSQDERRTIYLGWYQGLFVLGSSVGYFVGGILPEIPLFITWLQTDQLRSIFLMQAVFNLVHAIVIIILMKPSMDLGEHKQHTSVLEGFKNIRHMNRNLILFMISLSLISLGAINISKYIEVYMNKQGLLPSTIGTFVGATGVVSIIATIVLVPVVTRFKRDFSFMVGIQLLSAIIIFFVFRSNQLVITLYTFFMLYVVLKAIYAPLEQHYISTHAKPGEYGKVMGVRQSFFSIGMVLGPLIGGFLFELKPLYVFDFSAAMFLLGVGLLLIIGRNIKKTALVSE
ncbi:MFS transporter [Candidatus Xianfuyuplasma coldseepsis]|uniref:MFS transporter n=1 Tax=Candidatus Xianfuyuplasma coldseepsis TaxID=2782163 RepID=A0A7L7KTQ9_9MOLU|nr:MFS transporter [Xianfuyuplasma coldseepsis]QMS85636.1 MFS transporter [Xianfuyuplasma coldseepsis]